MSATTRNASSLHARLLRCTSRRTTVSPVVKVFTGASLASQAGTSGHAVTTSARGG
ncbi:hypothetical protein [Streptomyces cyaneofuscatus]|uniref:hypothetical protein n=1 Tax=Streptomyces cyaneofuscatus TaxID=66883 RepID=UPI0037BB29FD